jgi:hypothetical protein
MDKRMDNSTFVAVSSTAVMKVASRCVFLGPASLSTKITLRFRSMAVRMIGPGIWLHTAQYLQAVWRSDLALALGPDDINDLPGRPIRWIVRPKP